MPVADVVAEALNLVAPLAGERPILFEYTACELGYFAWADRPRFQLLSNAVKYNREGGAVTLSCSPSPNDAGRLHIGVRDSGRGIASHELERVWIPFERLDAETQHIEVTGIDTAKTRDDTVSCSAGVGGLRCRELKLYPNSKMFQRCRGRSVSQHH